MAEAKRVSRDDLEDKFRQLQGDVKEKVDERKPPIIAGAVIGGLLLFVLVYLLGKRKGNKQTTLVEIRRV